MGVFAAGFCVPAAEAHTLYKQWLVYRQKHLLIGCHRKDLSTWRVAQDLVNALEHMLPEASARPARAPHPGRLASLMKTRQLELAVLPVSEATAILKGADEFAAYGPVPLTRVAELPAHLLVGHEDFSAHHAWLVASALSELGLSSDTTSTDAIAWHRGVLALKAGVALEKVKEF